MNYPGAELRGIKQLTSLSLRDISPFGETKTSAVQIPPNRGDTAKPRGVIYN